MDRAVELAEAEIGGDSSAADRVRLAEVERETENLIRMAARVGKFDAYDRVLDELVREAGELNQRLSLAVVLDVGG